MTETAAFSRLEDLLRTAMAFEPTDIGLMTAEEAAVKLGICAKVFRAEVRAGRIRYVLVGKRRKYTLQDLQEYIRKQRDAAPCPSINQKARRSTTMTSSSKVVAFTELQARKAGKKPKR